MRNQEARQITKKFVCPLHQEVSRKSTTVHPEIDRKSAYLRKPWKLQTALFAVSPPGDFQKVHHSPPRTCQIIRLPEETREITKKSVRPLHLEISGKSTTFHPEIARKSAYPGADNWTRTWPKFRLGADNWTGTWAKFRLGADNWTGIRPKFHAGGPNLCQVPAIGLQILIRNSGNVCVQTPNYNVENHRRRCRLTEWGTTAGKSTT